MGLALRCTVIAALAAAIAATAWAQVPPHVPGTVCLTPAFWCWADPPGAPGAPCQCWTASGAVAGVLG
jgi:hypothetical protein